MARKNQHSFAKREREKKKAEKIALKRAKKAASAEPPETDPMTVEDPAPDVVDDGSERSVDVEKDAQPPA